jgi:hypothetical protein
MINRATVGGEVLVSGKWWNVDKIAALPFKLLRLCSPIPGKCVKAVKFQIPVQVVAGTFSHKDNLLPHMPMFAGAGARFQELHIGLYATLLGIEAIVHEVLDEPIRAVLEWHLV